MEGWVRLSGSTVNCVGERNDEGDDSDPEGRDEDEPVEDSTFEARIRLDDEWRVHAGIVDTGGRFINWRPEENRWRKHVGRGFAEANRPRAPGCAFDAGPRRSAGPR